MKGVRRRIRVALFVAIVLTALGIGLAAWDPWVAMWPLLVGLLLRGALGAVIDVSTSPQINTVPWTVAALNLVGWVLAILLIGRVFAKRGAA